MSAVHAMWILSQVQLLADDGWIVNLRGNATGTYDGRLLAKSKASGKYPSIAVDGNSATEVYEKLIAKAKALFPNGVD